RPERTAVEKSSFFEYLRNITLQEGTHEINRLLFQILHFRQKLLSHIPGICIVSGIIISNRHFIIPVFTIWKIPGKQKLDFAAFVWFKRELNAQCRMRNIFFICKYRIIE